MNSKRLITSALAALIIPAVACAQTGKAEGAKPVSVFGAPTVSAAVPQIPLTGDIRNDLALVSVMQDERPAQQTELQTANKKIPVVGGLLSLAVPGAGQVYSGSYVRAAIFVAAEVAGITWAILYNNKGDKRTQEFQSYADAHWSAVRYAEFLNHYAAQYRTNHDNATIDVTAPMDVMWAQINAYESGSWSFGFSHRLPKYGEQQYYELIGKYDQFKYGWDEYPHPGGIPVDDHSDYSSVPQQLLNYAANRGTANDFYAASRLAVSLVVLNHVASAVDAYLAARHYNASLSSNMSMERVGYQMAVTSRLTLSLGI